MNPADRAILSPPTRYASQEDFTPAWIAQVRGVIQRDSLKLRAGFPACIEIKGPNGWQPLLLPTNGIEFTGRKDRDAVLDMLRQPEPNISGLPGRASDLGSDRGLGVRSANIEKPPQAKS